EGILHMGACSSTTEQNMHFLMENNTRYTLRLATWCLARNARLVYASSAATYGDGSLGFSDDHQLLSRLRPLNGYGFSKHLFDLWAQQRGWLDKIAGLKYFNVFGPNEYHKDDMRSVVHKAFEQIRDTGKVRLFKSYHPDYKDGWQLRDFIYVKDAVTMTLYVFDNPKVNGIFNIGTGQARSFYDLAAATFKAMNKKVNIELIDMPPAIRDRYQYFTQADMTKLRDVGCQHQCLSLEESVADYVSGYLSREQPHLSS
ncbi:MAG: ADP-glyceromanno-heptose 6-epimerase, partial [Sedimentisphaerales bacterium]|nr:ADP-glyceromanno-heptose 6-epimerase [Sedimentisphaerales bacterium]